MSSQPQPQDTGPAKPQAADPAVPETGAANPANAVPSAWRMIYEIVLGLAVLGLVGLIIFGVVVQILNGDDDRPTPSVPVEAGEPILTEDGEIDMVQTVLDALARAEAARQAAEQARLDAEIARRDAENTNNDLNTLLSLLEGAGVLAGLALGAAAFYGIRSSREMRDTLKEREDEVWADLKEREDRMRLDSESRENRFRSDSKLHEDRLRTLSEDVAKRLDEMRARSDEVTDRLDQLAQYDDKLTRFNEEWQQLMSASSNVADLLLVYQAFNLKRYQEAHRQVIDLIEERNDRNPYSLYLAGWLEVFHISGEMEAGIAHLNEALKRRPHWPYARAALGAAYRRQAARVEGLTEDEREILRQKADQLLHSTLIENPTLIEPNNESYWGTLGGLWRDMGRLEDAQKAYEKAREVTPYSSYPIGNLGVLYLWQYKQDANKIDMLKKAQDIFRETVIRARHELRLVPDDYFHIMDIAMSTIMLSGEAQRGQVTIPEFVLTFDNAREQIERALDLPGVTPETYRTSLSGLETLKANCPGAWKDVADNLDWAIEQVTQAIGEAPQGAGPQDVTNPNGG